MARSEDRIRDEFRERPARDQDQSARSQVRAMLETLNAAEDLRAVTNVKKLKGGEDAYRIRVGDYRLGAFLIGETLLLVRFLHRRDIYRFFP